MLTPPYAIPPFCIIALSSFILDFHITNLIVNNHIYLSHIYFILCYEYFFKFPYLHMGLFFATLTRPEQIISIYPSIILLTGYHITIFDFSFSLLFLLNNLKGSCTHESPSPLNISICFSFKKGQGRGAWVT